IYLKRRHREKPKLITICDVSDSVRNASRFMLQLVWSLQECFSRVRSYVFVSEIAEVTQAFNTYPVERAIEWALKGAPVDYHCRSDFGFAFSQFTKTELDSLDRKTTILMLGDARNNYNDPQAWALRLIRERVYVANQGTVSVINTATNAVIATISTPGLRQIFGIAINPAGSRVYLSDTAANAVGVIDATNNSFMGARPVGLAPMGLAVDPSGTRVYVANHDDSSLSVIDATTNAVLSTMQVGTFPIGVAVSPSGSFVYVANNL